MKRSFEWLWILLYLLLFALIFGGPIARSQTDTPQAQAYDTILERVVPRQCLLKVEVADPSKCVFKGYSLTPESECRGPIGGQLLCTHFAVQIDGCAPKITRRIDCELTNVKKVPRREIAKDGTVQERK